jgi:hypothetical protein
MGNNHGTVYGNPKTKEGNDCVFGGCWNLMVMVIILIMEIKVPCNLEQVE